MSVLFKPENHSYHSIVDEGIEWISVTSLVSMFKNPFDAINQAKSSSKNKRSKWYGMSEDEILQAWAAEAKRSTDLGTWYHNQRERDITSHQFITKEGVDLPIFKPIEVDGVKYAPDQKLVTGIYPEHFVYLKSAGICGQSDLVEVIKDTVNITDHKTNKEIKTEGYKNSEGITKKLSRPVNHLDDCNYNHYALQLSLYLYIIQKHNPNLKPGQLMLNHVLFEEQARDKFDNPIYRIDSQGNFIVKDIVRYEVPYLKSECINIINWWKDNRSKIKLKKAA